MENIIQIEAIRIKMKRYTEDGGHFMPSLVL